MNPFDKIIKDLHKIKPQESVSLTFTQIGNYYIQPETLLTDDLASIFFHFRKNKKTIKDLVNFVETLPYAIKIDLMFYLSENKSQFKKLKKNKDFNCFIDGFSNTIAELKLHQ